MTLQELTIEVKREFEKVSYDVDDEDFNPKSEPVISFSDASKIITHLISKVATQTKEAMMVGVEEMKSRGQMEYTNVDGWIGWNSARATMLANWERFIK